MLLPSSEMTPMQYIYSKTQKQPKRYYASGKKDKDITEVLEMMKKELDLNHQIYVVAPMIEDGEESLESIEDLQEKMNKAFGKIAKIGVVHGKLDPKEKNKIMNYFDRI